MDEGFVCKSCQAFYEDLPPNAKCEKCESILEFQCNSQIIDTIKFQGPMTFWRYSPILPSIEEVNRLNWSEGGTPLIRARNLASELNISNLFLKDETKNPTHSYSDRASSLILSYALDRGYKSVVCASNGNSGASVAAYSAQSPISAKILVPRKVALGKLAQMYIYSDTIVEHGEFLEQTIAFSEKLCLEDGWFQATPELNPLSIEAQATISYEIIEQTVKEENLDWIIIPMGSGGLLCSIWKGLKRFENWGLFENVPQIIGVQTTGCAPIVKAYEEKTAIIPVSNPSTSALELLVKNPYWGDDALKAIELSGGRGITVTDAEILKAERRLARAEGIFAESASSATIAGLQKLSEERVIDKSDKIVCLITGSGLKEPYIIKALSERPRIMGQKVSTKLEILRILEVDASYGYKIWQDLGSVKSIQSIYQHLNELEIKELIKSKEVGNKKFFEITNKGKKVLSALETLVDLL